MSDDMIERVAEAIKAARTDNKLSLTVDGKFLFHFDRELARAAIEAMREPMREMLSHFDSEMIMTDGYGAYWIEDVAALEAWHRAIDTALIPEAAKTASSQIRSQAS